MILIIPPTPHGDAWAPNLFGQTSLYLSRSLFFSIFWSSWCLFTCHCISVPFFSSILDRFWLDFRRFLAPFLLQNRGQIQDVFSLVFGTCFSSIFQRFYEKVDMTNILRKCISYCVLQSQMRVGLVAMMSLLCSTFATTGLELQRFSAWFFIDFLTILASKIAWYSTSTADAIWGPIWAPFSFPFASLAASAAAILSAKGW